MECGNTVNKAMVEPLGFFVCKHCGHRAGTVSRDDRGFLWVHHRYRGHTGGDERGTLSPVHTIREQTPLPNPLAYLHRTKVAEQIGLLDSEGVRDALGRAFVTLECNCGAVLPIRAEDGKRMLERAANGKRPRIAIDPRNMPE